MDYTRRLSKLLFERENSNIHLKKSPSKMTEEEKIAFKNKLQRESEEISIYVTNQLSKWSNLSKEIKATLIECQNVQTKYQQEQDEYTKNLLAKKRNLTSNINYFTLPQELKLACHQSSGKKKEFHSRPSSKQLHNRRSSQKVLQNQINTHNHVTPPSLIELPTVSLFNTEFCLSNINSIGQQNQMFQQQISQKNSTNKFLSDQEIDTQVLKPISELQQNTKEQTGDIQSKISEYTLLSKPHRMIKSTDRNSNKRTLMKQLIAQSNNAAVVTNDGEVLRQKSKENDFNLIRQHIKSRKLQTRERLIIRDDFKNEDALKSRRDLSNKQSQLSLLSKWRF